MEENDDNAIVFGLTVPLNWFNRNQGGITKARYSLSKAQEENRAKEFRMEEALLNAYIEVSFSHVKVILINTEVMPGAKKALDAISEGYRFGKFGLLDVLDSQKTFFQIQSQYLDALANYDNAVAERRQSTMNEKISIGAIVILVIGAALAWGIINMDNLKFWKNKLSQY